MDSVENTFEELPEGLTEEILSNSKRVSVNLIQRFKEIVKKKKVIRKTLESDEQSNNNNDLGSVRSYQASACLYGSYTIQRRQSARFCHAATRGRCIN